MKTSRRFKKQRQFFDVATHHSSKKKRFGWLSQHHSLIDLRPSLLNRFPKLGIALFGILVIGVFFGRQMLIRAETASFYPKTCLGTWQNGDRAQGQPESTDSGASINAENAAEYPGTLEEIFCGGFLDGEEKDLGNITHVGVTLVWRVGEEEIIASNTPGVFFPQEIQNSSTTDEENTSTSLVVSKEKTEVATSSESTSTTEKTIASSTVKSSSAASSTKKETVTTSSIASSSVKESTSSASSTTASTTTTTESSQTDNQPEPETATTNPDPTPVADNQSTPKEEAPQEVVPPPTESTDSTTEPTAFLFHYFIPVAQAEETSSIVVVTSTTQENKTSTPGIVATTTTNTENKKEEGKNASSSTTEGILTEENLEKEIEKVGTTTPPTLEATTTIKTETVPPDDNFLIISYSINSSDWIQVGKVNKDNWRQLTLSLPISSWKDLERLQLRIQGVTTTLDPIPPVFLDGMFMEVHYEKELIPGIDSDPENNLSSSSGRTPSAIELQTVKTKIGTSFQTEARVSNQYRYQEWIGFNLLEDGQYDVYLKNEATGEVRQITKTPYNESYPVMKDGKMAWTFARGFKAEERGEIMLYDIASETFLQITSDAFTDDSPQFDEQGRLTWRKLDAVGVVHQFVYDLIEKTAIQIDGQPFTEVLPPDELNDND